MSIALRRMRWWDIERLLPLEKEIFGDESWSETLFWSELAQADTRHYLVAADGPRIVGYAGLCVYPDEAMVQTLAVEPSWWGAGIGGSLLSALLAESAVRGRRRVGLEVRADNPRAQALYARFGFRPVGVRRGYYQPSGTDAVVMLREDTGTAVARG